MRKKIIGSIFVFMLIIAGGIGSTQSIKREKVNEIQEENISSQYNVLACDNTNYKNIIPSSMDSKDQFCENGNKKYDLHYTSVHLAQGFKPTKNIFTKLELYMEKSTNAKGYYSVHIRNDSVYNDNWLYGAGKIDDISSSGEWVTFTCADQFVFIPGNTYYIIINLINNIGDDNSLKWRYSDSNPYNRGKAYFTLDDQNTWTSKDSWDFNFRTYGIATDPPNPPSCVSPSNGAQNVNPQNDITLKWDCTDPNGDSLKYDVYFGTSTPPTLYAFNHPNKEIILDSDDLFFQTLYYWKIVARDSNGAECSGSIWNFKTIDAPPGPPAVNYIETYFADGSSASDEQGMLLQGLDLDNTYKAFIAGENVDEVEFDFSEIYNPLEDPIKVDIDGADGWSADINTKHIINPFGSIKIRAHNDKGWGDVKTYTPKIIPIVGWLANYIQCLSENESFDYVTFEVGEKDDPPRPKNNYWTFEASIDLSSEAPGDDESPVDTEVDVPVDDIGGDYGYSGGVGSSIVFSSDGIISVSGGFHAEVEAKSFSGGIGASLQGTISVQDYEIVWEEMYITINGEVTIPVFVVPLSICGIGVEAGVDITPSVEIVFQLEPVNNPSGGLIPGLGIKIDDDGGISGNVAAQVRAYAGIGIVIADFYGEAGGKGTLSFKSNPPYFDNFVLDAWIGGRIRFLFWTAEGWYTYSWSYRDNKLISKDYVETDWDIFDRDYINSNYNKYVWDDNEEYGQVIENAFPHAKPSIMSFPDSAGTKLMIVYSHDNENKNPVEGMELRYTIWEKDVGMDEPIPIPATNDNKLQMDPQIAFDGNDNLVCVFVQTDSSINQNSDYTDAAAASEIAYCTWNSNSQSWSGINTITSNSRMDTCPVIASNDDGDIVVVWSSDADYDDPNPTPGDRSIFASYWDGSSWSNPETLASNQPIVTTPQVTIKDGTNIKNNNLEGLVVFSMDGDNNLETTADQNVYYINLNQISKDYTITQLTYDSYQDICPSAVYGEDGNPYVIWLKNKFYTQNNENLYDGTLYYQDINTRSSPQEITTGRVSDHIAISAPAGTKSGDVLFRVGWSEGGSTYTLNYANITTSKGVEKGVIFGAESKLSETDWSIAPAGISAATVERPDVKQSNDDCNISFVYTHGYDYTSPITSCSLEGQVVSYGLDGPQFSDDTAIDFYAEDEGGSSLKITEYRLDYSSWVKYNGEDIIVESTGPHIVHFKSTDKAGNVETIKNKIFEIIISHAPNKPFQPSGPSQGKPGVTYTYHTSTTDDDGDNVYYMWDWGDEIGNWMGPFESGKEVFADHSWQSKGKHDIRVKAKDVHGMETDWSEPFTVTVQKSRNANKGIMINLFEKFIHQFPILERFFFNYM